jgi:hypothetical protein
MHLKDLYTIVVTDKRVECRDFYLVATGDHPFGLAFMAPDHPSQPPGRDASNGKRFWEQYLV